MDLIMVVQNRLQCEKTILGLRNVGNKPAIAHRYRTSLRIVHCCHSCQTLFFNSFWFRLRQLQLILAIQWIY